MKNVLAALALALVLSVIGGYGVAQAASKQDKASGNVRTPSIFIPSDTDPQQNELSDPADVSFNAVANFNGSEPRGHASFTFSDQGAKVTYAGKVTCLEVAGNTAIMDGEITEVRGEPSPSRPPAETFSIIVTDTGKKTTDRLTGFVSQSENLQHCEAGVEGGSNRPVEEGQIVVRDG